MPNWKELKSNTLGTLKAALNVLDKYPSVPETSTYLSVDMSLNPFRFSLDILRELIGHDKLTKFVSDLIFQDDESNGLGALEVATKTLLLGFFRDMSGCSVEPFITYDMIRDGFVFNLRELDLLNIMRLCPLQVSEKDNSLGKYYYFIDKDVVKEPDDLVKASDFNAFIWYVKNRCNGRAVWLGSRKQENGQPQSLDVKQRKSDGIVTLEYNERSSGLTTADGTGLAMPAPSGDCLHVFIGDTRPLTDFEHTYANITTRIAQLTSQCARYRKLLEEIDEAREKIKGLEQNDLTKSDLAMLKKIEKQIRKGTTTLVSSGLVPGNAIVLESLNRHGSITFDEDLGNSTLALSESMLKSFRQSKSSMSHNPRYRSIEKNHYYHLPAVVFNTDYVMSMKFFDSKVLATQLLDALTGCMSIDVSMSMEASLVRQEVERMVRDVVETDKAVVNDCFFSFSNEQYDDMLRRAEQMRAGVYTPPSGDTTGATLDMEALSNALNGISSAATREEAIVAFEDAMNTVIDNVCGFRDETATSNFDFNYKAEFKFIENLLNNLAYVITLCVISPKLYLAILINLRIMGQDPGFDLTKFITSFSKLITDIIRGIRDFIMRRITEYIMSLVSGLSIELAARLTLEQYMYYRRMLERCLACVNGGLDWNPNEVGADIYNFDSNEPEDSQC